MTAIYPWLAALAIVMEERMTIRSIFHAAAIPVCVVGGVFSMWVAWPMVIPFAIMALAFTLALIWGE